MNLKEMYGKKYKIFVDESFYVEKFPEERTQKWRYYEIRGRYGFIYPYSASQLAACFTSIVQANKYSNASAVILQDGDDERTVLFPLEDFDQVVALLKPRTRRQITESQRLTLIDQLNRARSRKNPHSDLPN